MKGTTRDVVQESLHLKTPKGRILVRFEDTAGLRNLPQENKASEQTHDHLEHLGMLKTLGSLEQADIVLCLFDISQDWKQDFATLEQKTNHSLLKNPSRVFILANHIDQINDPNSLTFPTFASFFSSQGFRKEQILPLSALTAQGLPEFSQMLGSVCENYLQSPREALLITTQELFEAVKKGRAHLQDAYNAPLLDLFAAEIRFALGHLRPLVGGMDFNDILTHLFENFCIGK
jgi:tRNA modification GTPase